MASESSGVNSPGRPRGRTPQGERSAERIYRAALALFATQGFEASTLREIAGQAGVSVGLLYKHFPDKSALLLRLYDELSAEFVERASSLPEGGIAERLSFAIRTSLAVLGPHRRTLRALVAILITSNTQGLFAPATEFSRKRVRSVFVEAVVGTSPSPRAAQELGRIAYLAHLLVILLWLLDRSEKQMQTMALVGEVENVLKRVEPWLGIMPAELIGGLEARLRHALEPLSVQSSEP